METKILFGACIVLLVWIYMLQTKQKRSKEEINEKSFAKGYNAGFKAALRELSEFDDDNDLIELENIEA